MNRLRITENEEYLRTKSAEVDFKNDDIAGFITSLRAYCKKEFVYALAPIQIGIAKRIVYIRNSKEDMTNNMDNTYNEEIIYINPEIVASRGKNMFPRRLL